MKIMTISINHKQLEQHIIKAYTTKVPLYVWGTMGIGKSYKIKQTAKEIAKQEKMDFIEGWAENKFGFIDIRLSQFNPEDLKGLPMPDVQRKMVEWLLPNLLPFGGKGIILLDELNLAAQSIQASAYQLINDRKLSTYELPEGWIVVAAGNTSSDNGNVYELSAPLKNRFTHAALSISTADDWVKDYAVPNNISTNIISFLTFKKSYIHKFDNTTDDNAFATPRSWEFASKLIEGETDNDAIKRYVASAVGEGIANEYIAYHKLYKKLDIDDIIKHPEKFVEPKEVDIKYALAGGVAERYAKDSKLLKNIAKIWIKSAPEFVVISMKLCSAFKPKAFSSDILKLPEWDILSREYSKYI
jgi:hypothetical protein